MYYTIGFSGGSGGKRIDVITLAPGIWHTRHADHDLLDPGPGVCLLAGGDRGGADSSGADAFRPSLMGNIFRSKMV